VGRLAVVILLISAALLIEVVSRDNAVAFLVPPP